MRISRNCPPKPRADLERELLECYDRHRATWNKEDMETVFAKLDGELIHAFSHEILEIAARHGVPRAIAALKGEMSPEVKKATAVAKAMLKEDRAARRKRGEPETTA